MKALSITQIQRILAQHVAHGCSTYCIGLWPPAMPTRPQAQAKAAYQSWTHLRPSWQMYANGAPTLLYGADVRRGRLGMAPADHQAASEQF